MKLINYTTKTYGPNSTSTYGKSVLHWPPLDTGLSDRFLPFLSDLMKVSPNFNKLIDIIIFKHFSTDSTEID